MLSFWEIPDAFEQQNPTLFGQVGAERRGQRWDFGQGIPAGVFQLNSSPVSIVLYSPRQKRKERYKQNANEDKNGYICLESFVGSLFILPVRSTIIGPGCCAIDRAWGWIG